MNKIIILLTMSTLILLIGCNTKEDNIIKSNETELVSITNQIEEEWEDRCWRDAMELCQEHCSRISGLKVSISFLSFDVMQFDENNDSIVNGSEEKEMDYVLWRNRLCMKECEEEEVYDCFR